MSAADRYARARDPKPLSTLSRPELAARIRQLRQALDLLWSQSERDGGPAYACIGQMKITLITLESQLRDLDRQAAASVPVPLSVAVALAGRTSTTAPETPVTTTPNSRGQPQHSVTPPCVCSDCIAQRASDREDRGFWTEASR